ncbi:MAG: NADH:ubiquinone reductase (Na(+)-transporting) subunit A, partial [Woeseiaceae bacterium]
MLIRIRKGLDIPLGGAPQQTFSEANDCTSVALLGADVPGLKPAMAVREGDRVVLGDVLYTDKRNPTVPFVSPGCGIVRAVHRGERRVLQSVVVDLDGTDQKSFPVYDDRQIDSLDPTDLRETLVSSGQ